MSNLYQQTSQFGPPAVVQWGDTARPEPWSTRVPEVGRTRMTTGGWWVACPGRKASVGRIPWVPLAAGVPTAGDDHQSRRLLGSRGSSWPALLWERRMARQQEFRRSQSHPTRGWALEGAILRHPSTLVRKNTGGWNPFQKCDILQTKSTDGKYSRILNV